MPTTPSAVHIDPDILGGTPVFVGTRVPVQTLFDYIGAGDPLAEFLDDFPTVSREQAVAALEEARDALVARVHQYAREAGRDPAALPLEGRIRLAGQEPDGWTKQVEAWKALGATFLIAEPRGAGLTFPAGHLDALRRFKASLS